MEKYNTLGVVLATEVFVMPLLPYYGLCYIHWSHYIGGLNRDSSNSTNIWKIHQLKMSTSYFFCPPPVLSFPGGFVHGADTSGPRVVCKTLEGYKSEHEINVRV